MAAAVDWLDAYRAEDIDAILEMYSGDAVVECSCGGTKTIIGREDIRVYWNQRLKDYPASELDDLQPVGDGLSISYLASDGIVSAVLEFDREGKIARLRCGPRDPSLKQRDLAERFAYEADIANLISNLSENNQTRKENKRRAERWKSLANDQKRKRLNTADSGHE